MSGLTSEGTEFNGGRCAACGRDGYGMAEDGPRCYGCERFVLKDNAAGVSTHAEQPAPTLTMKMLDELMDAAPSPETMQWHEDRTRFLQSEWDRHRAAVRAMLPPPPKRRKQWVKAPRPLKADEVLAEADAILKESST